MGDNSKIEWTDATWNPVTGCTRVSEGCRNCYMARTVPRQGLDPWTVVLHPDRLEQPLRWKRPRRIFVNSLSDLFHEDVPQEFIVNAYAVMIAAWWHTFQILTKRPAKREFLFRHQIFRRDVAQAAAGLINKLRGGLSYQGTVNLAAWQAGCARNIHEGVSIENQEAADKRIPLILQTPAAVRFLSAEPLLGPVDMTRWLSYYDERKCLMSTDDPMQPVPKGKNRAINWVIVGGESGPGARPCDVVWIRQIKKQCKAAGVPCFVKQLGGYVADRNDAGFEGDEPTAWPMGTDTSDRDNEWNYQGALIRIRLTDRKGGNWYEWPEDLRIREFPR